MEPSEYRPIIIPKATVDLLLKQDKPSDLMALYLFYYYTAIWQKTNQPYCTDTFIRGKFRWGRDKIIRLRKVLTQIGLVELIKGERPKGEGAGSEFSKPYVKVNYYYGTQAVKEAELRQVIAELEIENKQLKSRMSENRVSDSSGVGSQDTNAYSSGSLNACSSNKEIYKEKDLPSEDDIQSRTTIPPTPESVTRYAKSINYSLNGDQFCDFYSAKGWIIGKTKMKDWQAAVRTWKRNDAQRNPEPEDDTITEAEADAMFGHLF